MAKRLQVILQEPEYREVKRAAQARRMSVAAWVRQALELARRREPSGSMERKLQVVRAAAKGNYPTADIDHMLAEIEMGYGADAGQ